jgi:ABC-type amino acid transport system permease subunit
MPPSPPLRRRRPKRTNYTTLMRHLLLAKSLWAGASVLSLLAFVLLLAVLYDYDRLAEDRKLMPRRNYVVAALVLLLIIALSVYTQVVP